MSKGANGARYTRRKGSEKAQGNCNAAGCAVAHPTQLRDVASMHSGIQTSTASLPGLMCGFGSVDSAVWVRSVVWIQQEACAASKLLHTPLFVH